MGKYCSNEAIITRLNGKVKFGEDDPNRMSMKLLNILVAEAESQVEVDLMDRYEIPFQRTDGADFGNLPDSSRVTLRNICELMSVIRVLETDFGRGTSANGDKYTEACQKRYDTVVAKLIAIQEQTKRTSRQWKTRPLDCLMVAFNNQGDNGFRGRVHNTSTMQHHADYATQQINSPGENIWNGVLDPLDHNGPFRDY